MGKLTTMLLLTLYRTKGHCIRNTKAGDCERGRVLLLYNKDKIARLIRIRSRSLCAVMMNNERHAAE